MFIMLETLVNSTNSKHITILITTLHVFLSLYSNHCMRRSCRMHDYCRRHAVWESNLWPFLQQGSLSAALASLDKVILDCWSYLYTELHHNPMKWCREEQSSCSLGFTSQSLHPNPKEMGKWSFQLLLMTSPGPLGLRAPQSSDTLELVWFRRVGMP